MNLASNGNVELMLPSPRWPDSVDMKGKAAFMGDTLLFKADTTGGALPDGRCALHGEPDRGRAAHRRRGHGHLRRAARGAGGDLEEVVSSGGPLLGDAVERAEPPDQVGAVDADHVPAGKQRRERGQGRLVARRVVRGHAARRRWRCRSWRSSPGAAGPRDTGPRHRQRGPPEGPAVLVGHAVGAAPGCPGAARSFRRPDRPRPR